MYFHLLKSFSSFLASITIFLSVSSHADTIASEKHSPDVSFEKVKSIFGDNINPTDTHLKLLLLAVAMDHTSTASTFKNQKIGIPYIVETGPGFWVGRLKNGDRTLEVLVNNALLLLFSKENIHNRKQGVDYLMRLAEAENYWPATFYLAETQLSQKLTIDYDNQGVLSGRITGNTRKTAQEVMTRYNRCAEIGFSPCQIRIGLWLASSPGSANDSIRVLRAAIQSTLSDPRYGDTVDPLLKQSAMIILAKKKELNINNDEIQVYQRLAAL